MHPTLILCLWLFAVLLTQRLPVAWLAPLLVVCVVGFGAVIRHHWVGLLRRSRWLLAILALTFLLMTPGERIDFLPAALPATWEGLEQSVLHLLRLLTVLFAVAWLVGGRTQEVLLAGFWGLAQALRSARLKRAVLRLALTLRYVTEMPEGVRPQHGWREVLHDLRDEVDRDGATGDQNVDGTPPVTHLHVELLPMPIAQLCLVATTGALTVWLWWSLS